MKRAVKVFMYVLLISTLLIGCKADNTNDNGKKSVVTTTTIVADVVREIGGDYINIEALMGPGVDPHLYKASAGDVKRMGSADMIIYSGLHLEGKMGDVFEEMAHRDKIIFAASQDVDESELLDFDTNPGFYDPHLWFDVSLWKIATQRIASGLKELNPEHSDIYDQNLKTYLEELDELDVYIREKIEELPKQKRILVTAHDAFKYFGRAYGFDVRGLQGISTDAEAGTADVRDLANFIAEQEIKAIFLESSVPRKNIEALQEAVKAQGFNVEIGGELYSDSTGGEGTEAESYIGAFKANIDTIVDALK